VGWTCLRERGVEWSLPLPSPLSRRPDSSIWWTGRGEEASAGIREGKGGECMVWGGGVRLAVLVAGDGPHR